MESLQLWPSSIAEFISENAAAMIRFIENCVFYSPEEVHVHSFPAQFFFLFLPLLSLKFKNFNKSLLSPPFDILVIIVVISFTSFF